MPTERPGPDFRRQDPQCPKRPAADAELGFERRPMVRWLDPHQLLSTAARVLASGFSTSYVDSREQQAHVPAGVVDRSGADELWLDYVSDLGDGWNSTYTVAWLLAQDHLDVAHSDDHHRLPRGSLLIMGGDQVYPVPTRTHYENRLLGPYRSAIPCPPPSGPVDLFAIPGSHDWYDGLVNFVNIFCRGRLIGGWRTSQARSYFAVRLPHRWWLWGVDLQFGDFLDEAQLSYFAKVASEEMRPGDRVVLCMAKEVESGRRSAEVCSDRTLAHLEQEMIGPAGGSVALYLKSGRHYYSRYAGPSGAQQITAGGGGAFLHPTHDLPEEIEAPGAEDESFRRAAVYPSAAWSKHLRRRVWLLPAYNVPLAAALGALQVLVVFMLNLHLDEGHRDLGFGDLTRALWESPSAFLLIIGVIATFGAMIRLAHDARGLPRLVIALGHSALQFGGLALGIVIASRLSAVFQGGAPSLVAFLVLVWVIGGLGGAFGVSAYLWVTNCMGFHANEAYAPLHHADQKNFLRLHIGPDGSLTVYPVGVERVARRWQFRPDAAAHAPWLAPEGAIPRTHLIEARVAVGQAGTNDGANTIRRSDASPSAERRATERRQ